MAGFATDTTITTYIVALEDGRYVHVTVENDGSGNEPVVTAGIEDGNEVIAAEVTTNRRTLVDGVTDA